MQNNRTCGRGSIGITGSCGSYRSRPAWREYNTRRFQNRMESLNLQEQQSELRLKAAEMAQELKIRSLDDRLQSQDKAIELMRQRHRNQTRDLKDLQGRRLSSSHYDNVTRGAKRILANGTPVTPVEDMRQFTKRMDQRYEHLMETKGIKRMVRLQSEQPPQMHNHLKRTLLDPVSYRSVKEMLNHLPITPIFKETTCSLMGISSSSFNKPAPLVTDKHDQRSSFSVGRSQVRDDLKVQTQSAFPSRMQTTTRKSANESIRGSIGNVPAVRTKRDVQVPAKDVSRKASMNGTATIKNSLYNGHSGSATVGKRSSILTDKISSGQEDDCIGNSAINNSSSNNNWFDDNTGNRRLSVKRTNLLGNKIIESFNNADDIQQYAVNGSADSNQKLQEFESTPKNLNRLMKTTQRPLPPSISSSQLSLFSDKAFELLK